MEDHENKPKVNAKAFVEDFVQGASDKELRDKYHLSPSQLARLVGILRQKSLVTPENSALRRENLTKRFGTPDGPPDPEKDRKVAVDLDTGLLLKCPGCGAPVKRGDEHCEHCNAHLDFSPKGKTKICPHCFSAIGADSRFCPHCGRPVHEVAEEGAIIEDRICPCCEIPMRGKKIGDFAVLGCDQCEGLFVSNETFEMMQDASDRSVFPSDGIHKGPPKLKPLVKYLKCPVCRKVMDRTNFAHSSGVVINICREHGIWFDPGQLETIMEIIGIQSIPKIFHFRAGPFPNLGMLKDPLELLGIGTLPGVGKEKGATPSSLSGALSSIEITGNSSLIVRTHETQRVVKVDGQGSWSTKKTAPDRFTCPICRTEQTVPFDKCPNCGILVNWST